MSKRHNSQIRGYTVPHAIETTIQQMLNANNPFTEFEAPIIKHFWEKRSPIEK